MVNAMSRETILRQYLDTIRQNYDFILLDCMPSLGMLTVNALAAADSVLIPVQAQYLPAKGLEQLLQTINKVRRQINPKLKIEGILLTMVDTRTNYAKDISNLIRESYGGKLKVYKTDIDYNGRVLFKHRGVNLLSYLENTMENERLRMITCTELWLLEDMTFTVVQYVGTMVKDGGDADCVTEYRRFVKNIKSEDDVFFSPEDLICALDDTCMFAQLFNKATICEL